MSALTTLVEWGVDFYGNAAEPSNGGYRSDKRPLYKPQRGTIMLTETANLTPFHHLDEGGKGRTDRLTAVGIRPDLKLECRVWAAQRLLITRGDSILFVLNRHGELPLF